MRIRVPPATPATPIGVQESARKYNIPPNTVSQWASRGEVQVLQRPAQKGDPLLLDEASLQKRIKSYVPHRDGAKRRIRRAAANPAPPHPTQPRPGEPRAQAHPPATATGPGSTARIAVRSLGERYALGPLVQAYLEDCERSRLDRQTIQGYRWALAPFVEAFPTLTLDRQAIIGYVKGLSLRPASMRTVYKDIKTFYRWLGREKQFPAVSLDQPRLPKRDRAPKFWTQEELAQILAACHAQYERAIVVGLAQTGARREEFVTITAKHFFGTWAKVACKVTEANETGDRILYIPQEAQIEITMAIGGRGRLYGAREPMSLDSVSEMVNNLLKRAGLWEPGVGCHSFRHSYEAEYLSNGGNPLYLPLLMGHMSGTMTSHYLHAFDQQLSQEAQRCAPRRFLQLALALNGQAKVAV